MYPVFGLTLYEHESSHVQAAGNVTVEREQDYGCYELDPTDYNYYNFHPMSKDYCPNLLVGQGCQEDPHCLPDIVDQEKYVKHENPQKYLIIPGSYTGVKIHTMMIKIFRTPGTSLTMITLLMYKSPTKVTITPRGNILIKFALVRVHNPLVHRIEPGDPHIGDNQPHHDEIVQGEEDVQDGVVDFEDPPHHEYRVQDNHQ